MHVLFVDPRSDLGMVDRILWVYVGGGGSGGGILIMVGSGQGSGEVLVAVWAESV